MSNREQDARIAKLIGWSWDDDWKCLIPPEQLGKPKDMWTDWKLDDENVLYRSPIKTNLVSHLSYNGDLTKIILPDYSSDISLAMQVIEWMRDKREFFITITSQIDGYLISVSDFQAIGHYYCHLSSVSVYRFDELADAICHIILETIEAGG